MLYIYIVSKLPAVPSQDIDKLALAGGELSC